MTGENTLLPAALTANLAQTIVIAVLPALGPALDASATAVAFLVLAAVHDRLWQFHAAGLLVGIGHGLAVAAIAVASAIPRRSSVEVGGDLREGDRL
ncbi:hypothetical protein ABZ912_28955 [Nonomuraea angiospora]|uniref:hypothetical protein n=1 Tax=Nonomuraea angiospora TaxID=46172 RepID=UPI0033E9CAF3